MDLTVKQLCQAVLSKLLMRLLAIFNSKQRNIYKFANPLCYIYQHLGIIYRGEDIVVSLQGLALIEPWHPRGV